MNEQTSQASTVESGQDQQILGFVVSTEGATVVVVSPDGTLRELKMGDPIHEGDILQVTDGSHISISFADGSVRQLNSGDSFVVGLDSYQQLAAIESAEEENPEFQDLLATLAAGEDIAENQEATAAGTEDGASGTGDEIGQGLQFSLLGGEVTPTAGIDPDYVPPPLPDPTANADISENENNNGETDNNDGAVVTNDARSVTEDQDLNPVDSVPDTVLSVTGAISVSDEDQGEGAFDPGTLSFGGRTNSNALDTDTTELGTLTLLDDQGNYSFAVDNAAVQYLAAGDTVVQTWTVDSVDGSGTSTITITINGVNDGAVVTNDARSVTEDQDLNPVDSVPDTVLSVTGAISVSDEDQGEGAFDPGTLSFGGRTNSNALDTDTTELGTLTLLDDQGNYSFAVDNAAVQYLAAGDTVVQTWTVDSVDGSGTSTITITINGVNDGAVVTNDARSVTEDQDLNPVDSVPDTVLSVTGAISVSDEDQGEGAFDPGTLSFGGRTNSNALDTDTTELGTLTLLDDQGNYSFAVDNAAVQYLAAGDTVVQTWTVDSVDGSGTSTITITINGVNDGAVVTNDARSVTEDQDLNPVDSVPDTVLSVTGAISVSDEDQGEGAFDPGTLSFGGRTNSNALDTDTTELGTLTLLDDQGNYSFAVDNAAVQYLAAGDTVVQTWTVDSVDGSGTSTITITINGVNDGAVVTNDARSVTEDQDLNPVDSVPDTVLSVTGAISVSDEDQGEGAFDPGTLSFGGRTNSNALDTDTTELGTLTLLDDQGNYSFAVDNAAVQYLAAGDTVVQTWTVDSVDGSGTSTITITINGTNDGPVANPDTNFVNKSIDGVDAPIISGNVISGGDNGIDPADSFAGAEQYADVADTDVDLGDALRIVSINNQSVSVGTTAANGTQLAGLYGVLTIGADGSYAYDLDDSNPLLADLDTGEALNEVFNYTVSDSSGAESSSTLTITVNGQDQGQPPLELGVTKNLYVGLDELVIKNLQVGFVDATFVNGTANTSEYNTDSDPYIDQLSWGRPVSSTGQSGYTLVDNSLFSSETGSTVDVGSTFKIADFQHLNFPIAVNSSILQEVYLVLNMDIVINGVHLEKPIDLKLLMSHDETPNDSGDPRDIISLPPQMITVNMDGFDYDFHVLGFRDVDGNLVDAIYTNENAVNDFEIVGSFTSSSENPQVLDSVSGTVGVGNDDVVTWADTSSEYGTLTVSEDGSYEYILNGDIKNVLDVGENLVDSFEYTVTNQNGSTTSTLEINISGYQNIYGSSGDDSLTGTSANEYLTGAAGDDVLNGAGGDDVLIGGPGNDILTGGLGADVFKWVAGDEGIGATDIVTDFNQSSGSYDPSEGDILDLSDLLVGLDSSGMTLAEALDASFLTITSDGTDTSIVADVDGAAAGTTTQTIVLQGVDLTNGGEFSSAEVIESLISNNNLVVD